MTEKIFVTINGCRQGMFLQTQNDNKPVLLFVHGGPGSPEFVLNSKYPSGLESLFTVCWWEQRGSGLSYSKQIAKTEMTPETMISDTVAVAEYLKNRFSCKKIYLMGHSWGSVLGLLAAHRHPELFYAYLGTGQIKNAYQSEQLAYSFLLNEFEKTGNQKMVHKLKKFSVDAGGELSPQYFGLRSQAMDLLGVGIMHKGYSALQLAKDIFSFRGYSWKEKINFFRGSAFSAQCLMPVVLKLDLSETVQQLEIPFYLFQGKFDVQTSYTLAKQLFEQIDAPTKGFYTFHNSAHSPCFEEAEQMKKILAEDVLNATATHADRL